MAIIFDIQRFSLFDGPGIRTAVFFKECSLDCPWCHNPESKLRIPKLLYRPSYCISCGSCAACPYKAHSINKDGVHVFDRSCCISCGKCSEVCPTGALKIAGQEMTLEEIMTVLLADRVFYEFGGGVTLTGGEPLVSSEIVFEILTACHTEGIHTAVETCGRVPAETMLQASRLTDLMLFDLKHPDSKAHQKTIGAGNEQILKNLHMIGESGIPLWIRIPFIPGFNTDQASARGFAAIIASVQDIRHSIKRIEVLPYHRMGASKCDALGIRYPADGIPLPDPEEMKGFAAILSETGIPVRIL